MQLFDTSKSFVVALIETLGQNITDYKFEQACREFGISEDEGMEKMMESTEYNFVRLPEGWIVEKD
jgi:hypothetical protein